MEHIIIYFDIIKFFLGKDLLTCTLLNPLVKALETNLD